jgi:hypothetical protein
MLNAQGLTLPRPRVQCLPMVHSEEIVSPLPPAKARDAIVLYLQKLNYTPTRPTFLNNIEMVRGSKPVTMISVSPRGWKTVVEAEIVPEEPGCRVLMKWTISTLGQVCTSLDIRYWKAEIRGARTLLSGGASPDEEIERVHAKTLVGTLGLVIGAIALFLVAFALLTLVVSLVLALLIAGALLVLAFILMRAPKDLAETDEDNGQRSGSC